LFAADVTNQQITVIVAPEGVYQHRREASNCGKQLVTLIWLTVFVLELEHDPRNRAASFISPHKREVLANLNGKAERRC
jgi:hypothetical protein